MKRGLKIGLAALCALLLMMVGVQAVKKSDFFASAAERCKKAVAHVDKSDPKSAESALAPCRQVHEDNPQDAKALLRLAMLEGIYGNRQESLDLLRHGAELGDGETMRELAYQTKSASMMHRAVAAYGLKAKSGDEIDAYRYAEISLWADDFYLKPHEQMVRDGTYGLFSEAVKKGAATSVINFAHDLSDPTKPAQNANDESVSEALYTIAAEQGHANATAGLASRAFTRSAVFAKQGNDAASSAYLDEAERLAKISLAQADGKQMTAGLLLENIRKVRAQPAEAFMSFLGGLISLAASSSSSSSPPPQDTGMSFSEAVGQAGKTIECQGVIFGSKPNEVDRNVYMAGC